MATNRKDLTKNQIPIFGVWVALANIAAIAMALIFYFGPQDLLGPNELVSLVVILVINILSIILLYPLFVRESIAPFMKSALIWFVFVSIVYIALGAYLFLILAVVQMLGDAWFMQELKKSAS